MAEEQRPKKAKMEFDPTPSTSKVSNICKAAVSRKCILDLTNAQFTQPQLVAPYTEMGGGMAIVKGQGPGIIVT
jgi:hypothetical protein